MPVLIEYHGKWLEWCTCTVDGDVLVDSFVNDWAARFWAIGNGWDAV